MVVRMRHTRSHTNNRRAHHALTKPAVSVCKDCQASKLSHKVCLNCGKYNGRTVLDVQAKIDKKLKKNKDREKAGVR